MLIGIGLGILGLLLIYFEFFVPGAILGIFGGVSMIAGVIFFAVNESNFWWLALYVVSLVLLLIAEIRFAIWKIKRAKDGFYARGDQEGYTASTFNEDLIGKEGEAMSSLRPSGRIIVDGNPYQVVSEEGFIKKGTPILIVRGEGARLIVRKQG